VHGPLGEQLEDGSANVATLAAAASTRAATSTAGAGAEAESGTARAESTGAEAATETAFERATGAAVLTDVLTKIAPGLPTVFVEFATIDRGEAESERGLAREGAVLGCEWGVHGV
jgi:hypothetical protein